LAFYSIVSASGFSGNSQRCSGSKLEGILLNGISTGSKYLLDMQYRSSVPLAVYSIDYSDYPTSTNNIPISTNTGSAKFWSGEFFSVGAENYIGLSDDGWMEIDQVRVKHIPNLISNGTFDSATGWNLQTGWTISGGKLIGTAVVGSAASYAILTNLSVGKRYRLSYEVSIITGGFYVSIGVGDQVIAYSGTSNVVTIDFVKTNASSVFAFYTSNFTGTIDNVHLYEIRGWASTGNHTSSISIADKYAGTSSLMLIANGAGVSSVECVTNGNCATYSGASPSQLATGWLKYSNDPTDTATIVSGSGFSGNAQRIEDTSGNGRLGIAFPIASTSGLKYKATITYRASHSFYFYALGIGSLISAYIPANTGNATTITIDVSPDYSNFMGVGFNADPLKIGSWIEISNVSVKQVLGEVSLPYANLETIVAGNKYTLEGWARLDPTSLTYGVVDKVTNGTNWTSATGSTPPTSWIQRSSNLGTFEIVDESGNSVLKTTSLSSNAGICQGITTVVGKVYKMSFRIKRGTNSQINVHVNTGAEFTLVNVKPVTNYFNTDWSIITEYFMASTTTSYIGFVFQGASPTYGYIDDVVVVESDIVAPVSTAQIGTKSVTSSALSIYTGSFTKFVSNFEATTSEVNQDLKLYLNNTGSVYVDKISITQAYDMAAITDVKKISGTNGDIFNTRLNGGAGIVFSFYGGKMGSALQSDTANIEAYPSSTNLVPNGFNQLIYRYITVENKIYFTTNGVDNGSSSLIKNGKCTGTLVGVGKGLAYGQLPCLISSLQILRFANISSSNFNPSTYKIGQRLLGGGNENVFYFNPTIDSSSMATIIRDWSGLNNHLSASNMDITNRVVTH
jgi:hypothetical protein